MPRFESAHLLLALLTLAEAGRMGRDALAARTGLGKGAVRTVIGRLKAKGYVDSDASGCHLTPSGGRLSRELGERISSLTPVGEGGPALGSKQVALAVRRSGRGVRAGIEQRDSAIRSGALGATTYLIKGGKFSIPGGSTDCEREFPGPVWGLLRRRIHPSDGDCVILCGAESETAAKLGALSAALTLL